MVLSSCAKKRVSTAKPVRTRGSEPVEIVVVVVSGLDEDSVSVSGCGRGARVTVAGDTRFFSPCCILVDGVEFSMLLQNSSKSSPMKALFLLLWQLTGAAEAGDFLRRRDRIIVLPPERFRGS
jgi:hypothetical protein